MPVACVRDGNQAPRAFFCSSFTGEYLKMSMSKFHLLLHIQRSAGSLPCNISWLALKEIGHEDLIRVIFIGGRQNVSALKSLGKIAEDVVDDEDCCVGRGRPSDICYEVKNLMERISQLHRVLKSERFS